MDTVSVITNDIEGRELTVVQGLNGPEFVDLMLAPTASNRLGGPKLISMGLDLTGLKALVSIAAGEIARMEAAETATAVGG